MLASRSAQTRMVSTGAPLPRHHADRLWPFAIGRAELKVAQPDFAEVA